MPNKILYIVLVWMCMTVQTKAQSFSASDFKTPTLHAGYNGDFIVHPGLQASFSFPVSEKFQENTSGGQSTTTLLRQWRAGPYVGFYSHIGNHSSFWLGGEWSRQYLKARSTNSGRVSSIRYSLRVAYLRYILAGQVFKANDQGGFDKVPLGGGGALYSNIAFHLGRFPIGWAEQNLGWEIGISLGAEVPHNRGWVGHLALELGVMWQQPKAKTSSRGKRNRKGGRKRK